MSSCHGVNEGALALSFADDTSIMRIQEGDHLVGFDSFRGEVPDGPDGQVAFESAEDGFDFGKPDVLAPEFGWIAALEISAQ